MIPEPGLYLALALLGGWIAIDGTGVGQFMVSRPLVAATLAGWVVGSPAAGAALGLVLEAFHLTVLPVGAARYPEGGPAALAAGAVFGAGPASTGGLLTCLVFFLGWQWLGGESMRLLRQANIRLLSVHTRELRSAGQLERWHLAAMGLDFLRGTLLVATGMAVLAGMLHLARTAWGLGERVPEVVVGAAVAALLAASLSMFEGRLRLFVAGVVGGLLLLLVRQ